MPLLPLHCSMIADLLRAEKLVRQAVLDQVTSESVFIRLLQRAAPDVPREVIEAAVPLLLAGQQVHVDDEHDQLITAIQVLTEERLARALDRAVSRSQRRATRALHEHFEAEMLPAWLSSFDADRVRSRRRLEKARRQHRKIVMTFWSDPLDRFDLLVELFRSIPSFMEAEDAHDPDSAPVDDARDPKATAIAQIHARGTRVVGEIALLLRGGFADGAFARWRAFHELAVIATFLSAGDADLSEAYLDHRVVGHNRKARSLAEHGEQMGEEPLDAEHFEQVEAAYVAAVERYGKPFKQQYGWANAHLKTEKRVTFEQIEKAAGLTPWRLWTNAASDSVHAGSEGCFYSFGGHEPGEVPETEAIDGLNVAGCKACESIRIFGAATLTSRTAFPRFAVYRILAAVAADCHNAFEVAAETLAEHWVSPEELPAELAAELRRMSGD